MSGTSPGRPVQGPVQGGVQPLVEHVVTQAEACARLGSPMYADLLTDLAEDLAIGGPSTTVLAGHPGDLRTSALALRLLGSVHRLVLERRAGDLAAYYPSVGGAWERAAGWAAFHALLARDAAAVGEWLDSPPQTNEVGRAAALMGGLLHLPDRLRLPVRLVEIGASGGLNLRFDYFRYDTAEGPLGDSGSPVRLADAWGDGPRPWPHLRVASRVGGDLDPVDVTTTEGRLRLTAYVWPDQRDRLERLRAAFLVADRVPAAVRRQGAADLVSEVAVREGHLTVLWHSVMWQYVDAAEQALVTRRLLDLGGSATREAPFVHLALEPDVETGQRFQVTLETWPGGEPQVLGTAAPHGIPVVWAGDPLSGAGLGSLP